MKSCNSRESADQQPNGGDSCDGCALDATRRDFLREAIAAVAVVAGGLGLVPTHALAFQLASATRMSGSEATYPLPPADGVTIDKEREVILVRWQGMLYAFRLACPHQRTALKWKAKDERFQCPKHKSKYQPDGTFISGRATRGMDRHAVRRNGNEVVVDLSKVYLQDKDGGGWTAAVVKL
jgi:Rieske Fe-S protein